MFPPAPLPLDSLEFTRSPSGGPGGRESHPLLTSRRHLRGEPPLIAHSKISPSMLTIDPSSETERIVAAIRGIVLHKLKRKGAVVGVSGGVDSSVVAYLCARALGTSRVLALFMPEADSSSESLRLGRLVAETLGVPSALEDLSPILHAARCYERRDAAIRTVIPEYGPEYKSKIILPDQMDGNRYPIFSVIVQSPDGITKKARLTLEAYLGIVAATDFKQRARKMMEYYYADLHQYAVVGTPNRLEYDLGFFVKNGDGAADLKPVAHLYKSQVYQLAAYLGVPEEIQRRPPTTDTYSLEQSQEEFYFTLSLEKMDYCLYGRNNGITAAELAPLAGLDETLVERAYAMIDAKRRAARYLHAAPLLVDDIDIG
jgi:NAD+ synthase